MVGTRHESAAIFADEPGNAEDGNGSENDDSDEGSPTYDLDPLAKG